MREALAHGEIIYKFTTKFPRRYPLFAKRTHFAFYEYMLLETKRLILRPPVESDWQDVVDGVSDLEVSRMLLVVPHPYAESDANEFIARVIKCWSAEPQTDYTFFIESKETGKVIGSTGLHKVNHFDGTTATGSWIRRDHWRQGYIIEAKIQILDFAFEKLKLRRIETCAFTENVASQSMSKKLGFKQEGICKAASRSRADGEIHDEIHYALFKPDWEKAKKQLLSR